MEYDLKWFEAQIREALDSLPEEFGRKLENVSVEAGIWPTMKDLAEVGINTPGASLFGLYRGLPQTKRMHYSGVLPDKIIIFAGPLMTHYGHDPNLLIKQIRNTLLHEIGHHFGMSEEKIRNAQKT